MYKNILFIILIVVVILLLYKLYQYYQKQQFINELIEEWQKITNGGNVKQDDHREFKGDYYLSINKTHNYYSHIHLIINDIIFKNPEENNDVTCYNLCYMAKKHDLHSELHIIDQNKSPKTIAEDMYRELYFFKD